MAMSVSDLQAKMKANIEAAFGSEVSGSDWMDKFCSAVAQACYDEITQNAVVNGPVTVASVTGVSPGSSASGPGTGTVVNATIT